MTAVTPQHSVVSQWLDDLHRQGKSRHTIAAYRRALTHFTNWSESTYGQAFTPAEVIARDVRDWKSHQQTVEGAKPSTINQRLVGLSRFFSWAVAEGLVRTNPTETTKTLRPERRKPKALDSREQRRLLRAVHAHGSARDVAMVEVLLGTGLRVGELLDLVIRDLQMGERSGQVTVRRGKHGVHRTVPLTVPVRRALWSYLQTHPQPDVGESALWHGERGPLQDRSAVSRMLGKYVRLAQIDKRVGPHTLRHTFATRYLDANPHDLRGLAALLGHASLDTVMIYTEPSAADLAQRLDRMEMSSVGETERR
jgi:integrase/recombinase XerC